MEQKQMELKTVTDGIRAQLRYPLPQWAFSKNGSKTFLTAINPMSIVQRLNDVFGIGKWQLKVIQQTETENGAFVSTVRLSVPEFGICLEQSGGANDGGSKKSNYDAGDAAKGSVTDAFTKCASYLEIGAEVFSGGKIKSIKGKSDLIHLRGLPTRAKKQETEEEFEV